MMMISYIIILIILKVRFIQICEFIVFLEIELVFYMMRIKRKIIKVGFIK